MTQDDLVERAKAGALPSIGEPELDPISLIIIAAALSAAVGWLVERCLDSLWPKDLASPTLIHRFRLRHYYVRPAVEQAIAAKGLEYMSREQRADIEDRVMGGLLYAGRTVTARELDGLKRSHATSG